MKFGISLFPLRPQQMIDVTQKAEELGFDSVWLGEHVVTPWESNSKFPYADGERDSHDNFSGGLPFYDPYAVLSYLAAITKRVRLAVSVSIVPLHDPFRLARSATTLALLSDDRFIFGMGGGWLKEEFDIMERDFKTRGKRFNETIEIMNSLFTQEVTEYNGEVLRVPPVGMVPKPIQPPPYVFGGHSPAALKRMAKYGSGWLASEATPEEMAPLIEQLQQLREVAGRADLPFEISCHLNEQPDQALIDAYAETGVTRLVVRNWTKGREAMDGLLRMAETLDLSDH